MEQEGTVYSYEAKPTETTDTTTERETLKKEFFALKNILSGLTFEIAIKTQNQTEITKRMIEINTRLNEMETTTTEAYHEKN